MRCLTVTGVEQGVRGLGDPSQGIRPPVAPTLGNFPIGYGQSTAVAWPEQITVSWMARVANWRQSHPTIASMGTGLATNGWSIRMAANLPNSLNYPIVYG